ncbi:protein NRT1/ PTR FAMILY 5.6 [Beta vulgaris subsp. vulgaris]|uniref:protein NRT1/ PTR FAMILY 5.6 n=1 Tax=Beta vulgaris subsp. vulgaris TaxID=3555 RepID=UPI002036D98E|nr:protein NRT1/ PTR FAMILY 5.6 [Beta vulgaris subsp. vulgaris]
MHETRERERNNTEISTRKCDENNVMELQVHDSSLDFKGKLPLRASTGSWKASSIILAMGFSEIMCYFGMAANMITYMTKVMNQDLKTAANSVNLWIGVTTMMPLLGGFLADAYTGRYIMIIFSAILYTMSLAMFTMAQYIPSLKPCGTTSNTCQHVSNIHKAVFFAAAYLMAVATGGYKPCLESFGADQFDDNHPKERKQKMSFFNWWNVGVSCGLFVGVTLIVYVQENVSWGICFILLTTIMGVTVLVLLLGRPFYRYKIALGSPLTPLLQVLVAAFAKRNLPCPSDHSLLYEVPNSEKLQRRLLGHTNRLRFLDKAAIIENHELNGVAEKKELSPWRLSSVTQVEELKLIIVMLPIWLITLVFGIGNAQGTTFFIKQGYAMNRKVIKHFEIPAASMGILSALGMTASITLYDKLLLPYLRRVRGNERGISILTRIGIGMFILIISMVISALVERKRLNASSQGKIMHIFWLVPQIFIMGIGDGFSLVGLQEYFYEQVPDLMRSLGMAFYLSVIGVGSFLTSLLIIVVDYVTGMNNGKRWIGPDVNHSRLEYFYWLLVVIFVLNLCVFMMLAKNYRYKNVESSVTNGDFCDGEEKVGFSNL